MALWHEDPDLAMKLSIVLGSTLIFLTHSLIRWSYREDTTPGSTPSALKPPTSALYTKLEDYQSASQWIL